MVALLQGKHFVGTDGAIPVMEFHENNGSAATVKTEAIVLGEASSSVEVSVPVGLEG